MKRIQPATTIGHTSPGFGQEDSITLDTSVRFSEQHGGLTLAHHGGTPPAGIDQRSLDPTATTGKGLLRSHLTVLTTLNALAKAFGVPVTKLLG